jgi:hypothetical protein
MRFVHYEIWRLKRGLIYSKIVNLQEKYEKRFMSGGVGQNNYKEPLLMLVFSLGERFMVVWLKWQ